MPHNLMLNISDFPLVFAFDLLNCLTIKFGWAFYADERREQMSLVDMGLEV